MGGHSSQEGHSKRLLTSPPAIDDGVEGDVMLIELPVVRGVDVDEVGHELQWSAGITLFVCARVRTKLQRR